MSETRVVRVDRRAPEPGAIEEAARVLRAGGVVAIPTETVYGLAARAHDAEAVARIFDAKGRPAENPLIVHVRDAADASTVVRDWPARAEALAARFWPGPLTLVLPRAEDIPTIVTAGLDTVAVRAPAHAVARAVIGAVGPIAAPSANRSNEISPTSADHVLASLGGRIPLILDAGPTDVGIESTVLSLTSERATILRPGMVTRAEIAAIVGEVDDAHVVVAGSGPRPSPGTGARHYAPRAEVVLVDRGDVDALAQAMEGAEHAGALVYTMDPPTGTPCRRLSDDPRLYAQMMYAALHELDARCDRIVIERVPDDEAWRAVADRLARASH